MTKNNLTELRAMAEAVCAAVAAIAGKWPHPGEADADRCAVLAEGLRLMFKAATPEQAGAICKRAVTALVFLEDTIPLAVPETADECVTALGCIGAMQKALGVPLDQRARLHNGGGDEDATGRFEALSEFGYEPSEIATLYRMLRDGVPAVVRSEPQRGQLLAIYTEAHRIMDALASVSESRTRAQHVAAARSVRAIVDCACEMLDGATLAPEHGPALMVLDKMAYVALEAIAEPSDGGVSDAPTDGRLVSLPGEVGQRCEYVRQVGCQLQELARMLQRELVGDARHPALLMLARIHDLGGVCISAMDDPAESTEHLRDEVLRYENAL